MLVQVHSFMCAHTACGQRNVCVSLIEQMLYNSGEVSSGADEGLKVSLSVCEAHRAQLLQLLLKISLLMMNLTAYDRRVI